MVLTTAAVSAFVLAIPAQAGDVPSPGVGGDENPGGIGAHASAYDVTYEPATPPPGHPLKAASGWTPPACWLAPRATPAELKTEREATWGEESTGAEWEASEPGLRT